MTQFSVLYFECRCLQTENVPRRQHKNSGLIVFGKNAVCSEKQIHNIIDVRMLSFNVKTYSKRI